MPRIIDRLSSLSDSIHGVQSPVDPGSRRKFVLRVAAGLALSTPVAGVLAACAPADPRVEPTPSLLLSQPEVEQNQVILTKWKEMIEAQLENLFVDQTSTFSDVNGADTKKMTEQSQTISTAETWESPTILVTKTVIQGLEHQIYLAPNLGAANIVKSPSGKYLLELPLQPTIIGTNHNSSGAYLIDRADLVSSILYDPTPRSIELTTINQLFNSAVFNRKLAAETLLTSTRTFKDFQFRPGSKWYFDSEKQVWQREIQQTEPVCLSNCD
ncbi:hypothetical protein KC921_05035 [Candidatus Woesebacteria bacterium]|nr:hypothetical protein [Candidatus Woesebacteria bacterium]